MATREYQIIFPIKIKKMLNLYNFFFYHNGYTNPLLLKMAVMNIFPLL